VPPGLQGILDDFWQRPIVSVGEIDGRKWAGDVGLPGPDRGKGGKYLVLPPDYKGETPEGYFTLPLRHLWPVRLLARLLQESARTRRTRARDGADADLSAGEEGQRQADAIPRRFGRAGEHALSAGRHAFDMLSRFINHEYVDPADMYMRGMAAELGIVKGQPFRAR
jgi:hypothetical protein